MCFYGFLLTCTHLNFYFFIPLLYYFGAKTRAFFSAAFYSAILRNISCIVQPLLSSFVLHVFTVGSQSRTGASAEKSYLKGHRPALPVSLSEMPKPVTHTRHITAPWTQTHTRARFKNSLMPSASQQHWLSLTSALSCPMSLQLPL